MKAKWTKRGFYLAVVAGLFCAGLRAKTVRRQAMTQPAVVDADVLHALHWRSIGPPRGGRAPAVAGDPDNPEVFYFGAAGGGVWKTYDAGLYWQNVSDAYFKSSSVGAIAVAPSGPNVIYVGMGEIDTHPDILGGDGVYKSTDAGETWVNVGLQDTRHIGKIEIDPHDPNVVYVAALGHEFGPNTERGVFCSRDGGKTWQKILYVSDRAGAADLSMDPTNPNVIYASIWQFMRQPWSEISGGSDSGLYKSTDGGDHWTNISRNPGLPKGVLGKIGVSVCASEPSRVYAVIEAADGGLFRSDDAGATWQLVNNSRSFRFLASSYTHVVADPQNPDVVYVLWMELFKSTDGGRTLNVVALPHSDNHSLWIDSKNDKRMIEGSDGGTIVTMDGGNSWSSQYNQPTGEYYKMTVDNQFPYRVYATQMDNSAISCPSRVSAPAIEWKDCYPVGSAESGSIQVRPDDANIIFAGSIGSSEGGGGNMYEFDHSTGEQRMITVWPEDQYGSPVIDVKYRFYFTYPLVISPHDPNVLYTAAQYVFRSTDNGASWKIISPDLTKDDKSHMSPIDGGPITSQQFSSQYTSTVYSFAESPLKAGELWAGSDDGSVHYSPDGGKTWLNRSPQDLAEWTGIYTIEPSSHAPGTVYIAANRHELDDHTPIVEMTTDYGKTWRRIDNGIPQGDYAWVVREDPVRAGLLYAGTEGGVFVSFDDGAHWQSLRRNMPVVAVRDMMVKDNDLVAATHGRAFWILDGLNVLREMTSKVTASSVHLFTLSVAYRMMGGGYGGRGFNQLQKFGPEYLRISGDGIALHETKQGDETMGATYLNAGTNPPKGIVVTYYVKQKPDGPVTLTFMDSKGQVIKQFSSEAGGRLGPRVETAAGTDEFVWDMTYPSPREVPVGPFLPLEWARARAPIAVPGTYKVRLSVGGQNYEQSFEIRKDPRIKATQQDLQAQFDLMIKINDEVTVVTDGVDRIHQIRRQVDAAVSQVQGRAAVTEAAKQLDDTLTGIEGHLTRLINPTDSMMVPPKTLNIRLAELTTVVESADAAPTQQSYDVFKYLSGQANNELVQLKAVEQQQLPSFLKLAGSSAAPER
ncbi:MAG TPA: hypothetical protein VND64_00125 [Pirellulales bacterium]|nr:hypothetical protein [Pirellulales bacterium]